MVYQYILHIGRPIHTIYSNIQQLCNCHNFKSNHTYSKPYIICCSSNIVQCFHKRIRIRVSILKQCIYYSYRRNNLQDKQLLNFRKSSQCICYCPLCIFNLKLLDHNYQNQYCNFKLISMYKIYPNSMGIHINSFHHMISYLCRLNLCTMKFRMSSHLIYSLLGHYNSRIGIHTCFTLQLKRIQGSSTHTRCTGSRYCTSNSLDYHNLPNSILECCMSQTMV